MKRKGNWSLCEHTRLVLQIKDSANVLVGGNTQHISYGLYNTRRIQKQAKLWPYKGGSNDGRVVVVGGIIKSLKASKQLTPSPMAFIPNATHTSNRGERTKTGPHVIHTQHTHIEATIWDATLCGDAVFPKRRSFVFVGGRTFDPIGREGGCRSIVAPTGRSGKRKRSLFLQSRLVYIFFVIVASFFPSLRFTMTRATRKSRKQTTRPCVMWDLGVLTFLYINTETRPVFTGRKHHTYIAVGYICFWSSRCVRTEATFFFFTLLLMAIRVILDTFLLLSRSVSFCCPSPIRETDCLQVLRHMPNDKH